MRQEYKKAPITEATIEFRLSEPLSDRELDRVKAKFKHAGWAAEDLNEINVRVGPKTEILQTPVGQKLTSADARHIIQIMRKSLVVSRNAPYNGWEAFSPFVKGQYERWRKIIGKKELERVGVRYINRIDIPTNKGEIVNAENYITFVPPVMLGLEKPALGWQIQVLSRYPKHNIGVTLTAATVESPLIEHVSILLDCDLYRYRVDVPQTDDHIWRFLELVRESKNEIFETCITDSTRKLIA